METRETYRAGSVVYVRAGCLLPANAGWEVPTKDEVRATIERAGLDVRGAADFLGTSRKEVNRWTTGDGDVPFACWALLCRRAGVGYQSDWW